MNTAFKSGPPTGILPQEEVIHRRGPEGSLKSPLEGFLSQIEQRIASVGDHSSPVQEPNVEFTQFKRRIILTPNQQVDVPRVMQLSRLYGAEMRILNTSYQHSLARKSQGEEEDEMPSKEEIEKEAASIQAMQEFLVRNTNLFARHHNLTSVLQSDPLSRAGAGDPATTFSDEINTLFREFFVENQSPNAGELDALATFTQSNVGSVKAWFDHRRQLLGKAYYGRWTAMQNGGSGHHSRGRQGSKLVEAAEKVRQEPSTVVKSSYDERSKMHSNSASTGEKAVKIIRDAKSDPKKTVCLV